MYGEVVVLARCLIGTLRTPKGESRMNCKWSLALAALLTLTGCAAHRPQNAFRAVLEPSCLLAPIVIEDCDLSREPMHCRVVKLRYRRGCEKIEVKQGKK